MSLEHHRRSTQSSVASTLPLLPLLLFLSTAPSQAGESPLSSARALLSNGQPKQAVQLLQPQIQQLAGNAEYDFLLGMALYQSGSPGEALFAFERVLMVDPSQVEARLWLARIALERGRADYASELLAALNEPQLTDAQREQMQTLRKPLALARQGDSELSGYVRMGLGWDSNVTRGPDATELVIPALSASGATQLGDAAADSDSAAYLEGSISWRQPISERLRLMGNTSFSQSLLAERQDVNEGYLNLDLGMALLGDRNLYSITLLGQDYRVEDSDYRHTLSARANWVHALQQDSHLNLFVQYSDIIYPENPLDDAERTTAGFSHSLSFSLPLPGSTLQYGLYLGREDARDTSVPHFDFDLWGGNLGVVTPINDRLSLAAGVSYEERRHRVDDALYLFRREDQQWSAALSLDYQLSPQWHLEPQLVITRNDSTTELYGYSRDHFMLSLRWDFNREKK